MLGERYLALQAQQSSTLDDFFQNETPFTRLNGESIYLSWLGLEGFAAVENLRLQAATCVSRRSEHFGCFVVKRHISLWLIVVYAFVVMRGCYLS